MIMMIQNIRLPNYRRNRRKNKTTLHGRLYPRSRQESLSMIGAHLPAHTSVGVWVCGCVGVRVFVWVSVCVQERELERGRLCM